MADDEMTQRERRAQRQRSNPGKSGSGGADWGRRWKMLRAPLVILLIIAGGAAAIYYLNQGPSCPDHWHGTFAVFTPSGEPNAQGYDAPHRIDWNSPHTASGAPYYNYGTDPAMSATVHMHQNGPEQGSAALGPAQFHFEGAGKCIGIQKAFNTVDLNIDSTSVGVAANTPLATVNGATQYSNHGNQTLHFYIETLQGGEWTWSEQDFGKYLHYQMRDGESILVAFGHYTDAQVKDMQSQVPPPISRVTPTPASATSASTSGTTTAPVSKTNSTSSP